VRRRRRAAAGLVAGLATAVVVSVTTGVARAQEADVPELAGFQGRAASSGLYAYYTPEGATPISPLLELGAPDALATIASGPATFARAAALDPGDILANPDAVFTLASPDYPQGTVPAYPYRVSATSGFGAPTAEASPAPGLGARVEATPEGSTARATMPRADGPAVATVGSMSSLATTRADDTKVEVHVRTVVSDVDLLGILKIDSVVTDLTATSEGVATKLAGGTKVTGATVMDEPVEIGADGIRGGNRSLNELLTAAGIHVTAAGPVEQQGGTSGQLASTGLRIELELSERTLPAIATLADLVPPVPELAPGAPTVEDVVAAARARHIVRLELARGVVTLSTGAAEGVDDLLADVPLDPPLTDALADVGPLASGDLGTLGGIGAPLRPGGGASPAAPVATTRAPNVPLGAGVGALVLVAFLVQPILGARLAALAGTVLAAGGPSCPLEER
jgi:hypothetical protein